MVISKHYDQIRKMVHWVTSDSKVGIVNLCASSSGIGADNLGNTEEATMTFCSF